jgi:hypothetical protein
MKQENKMIKCACGDKNCKANIRFESPNKIWLTGKSGEESLMYIDIYSLIDMSKELKDLLTDHIDSLMKKEI